jgi:uncharacterized repeat protein (TIGR01451 family)
MRHLPSPPLLMLAPGRRVCAAIATTALILPLPVASQTLTWSVQPRGVAVAADAAENVFTVDWEATGGGDILLTKTSPQGVTLFTVKHDNTDTTRHEAASWLQTDRSGGVFVSGTVRAGSMANPVNAHGLLMRFNAQGRLLWRRVLGTDFDGGHTVRVVVDAQNHAYVLGVGPSGAGLRARIHKVSPSGTLVWTWTDTQGIGAPAQMKWGADGSLVVAARAITGSVGGAVRVSAQGQTLSSVLGIPAMAGVDATADSQGHLVVASVDPVTRRGRLAKHDATGAQRWLQEDTAAFSKVEVTPDGALMVGGTTGFTGAGLIGLVFLKFAADGSRVWAQRDADGPGLALMSLAQMRVDPQGHGYLAASNLQQMAVTRVNADGSLGWTVLASYGQSQALAFGATSQAVYVVGGQTARIDQGGTPPPPPPAPDLVLSRAAQPDTVAVGGTLTLTSTLRNAGDAPASGVTFGQTVTGGLRVSVVSVTTSQGHCTAAVALRCSLGRLAPGQSVTIVQQLRSASAGVLGTEATAQTRTPEPLTSNNRGHTETRIVQP